MVKIFFEENEIMSDVKDSTKNNKNEINVAPEIRVRINKEKVYEKYMEFLGIIAAKTNLSKNTIKKSKNEYLQEIFELGLNLYFEDFHEDLINKSVTANVKRVIRSETKYLIDKMADVNERINANLKYLKAISNASYHINIEGTEVVTNDAFFNVNEAEIREHLLDTPVTLFNEMKKIQSELIIKSAKRKKNL